MGSNVNNATSEGQGDVTFDSKDIIAKTKAGQKKEYFVKFKNKTAKQKSSEWFSKHKKKIFIIMCAVVVAAVAAFVAIKVIFKNEPEVIHTEELDFNTKIDEKYDEIFSAIQASESSTPYTDVENQYLDAFNNETDNDNKFVLAIALGRYFTSQEEYDKALEIVRKIDWELTQIQQFIYYSSIRKIYYISGDEESAEQYDAFIEAIEDKIFEGGEK